MRKIHILLATLSLSIASPNLLAQIPTNQLDPKLDSTALNSNSDIPNYNALPPEVNLLRNAVKNPDGSLTIKAGQQTPEANEINRKYCANLGGIDITNESDQTIGAGTLYSVACKGSVQNTKPPISQGTHFNPFGKK